MEVLSLAAPIVCSVPLSFIAPQDAAKRLLDKEVEILSLREALAALASPQAAAVAMRVASAAALNAAPAQLHGALGAALRGLRRGAGGGEEEEGAGASAGGAEAEAEEGRERAGPYALGGARALLRQAPPAAAAAGQQRAERPGGGVVAPLQLGADVALNAQVCGLR